MTRKPRAAAKVKAKAKVATTPKAKAKATTKDKGTPDQHASSRQVRLGVLVTLLHG